MTAPECWCSFCDWVGGWAATQYLSDDLPECPECGEEVVPIAERWPEKNTEVTT